MRSVLGEPAALSSSRCSGDLPSLSQANRPSFKKNPSALRICPQRGCLSDGIQVSRSGSSGSLLRLPTKPQKGNSRNLRLYHEPCTITSLQLVERRISPCAEPCC